MLISSTSTRSLREVQLREREAALIKQVRTLQDDIDTLRARSQVADAQEAKNDLNNKKMEEISMLRRQVDTLEKEKSQLAAGLERTERALTRQLDNERREEEQVTHQKYFLLRVNTQTNKGLCRHFDLVAN